MLPLIIIATALTCKSSAFSSICDGPDQCKQTTIECPSNQPCYITCSGSGSCNKAVINGTLSSSLDIDCIGGSSLAACAWIEIYCPPKDGSTQKCTITADDALHDQFKLYAVNSWDDINIIYSGTWFLSVFGWGTMYCTQDYTSSCYIKSYEWTCENTGDLCNNPPTSPPISTTITSNPTFIPITANPATSNPTSSAPTTAIPTVSPTTTSPTTTSPTTASPTTMSPATMSPTTMSPTTMSPTTISPTTTSPTTTSPTNASPTTAAPTTAAPTTTSPTIASPTNTSPTQLAPTTSFPIYSTSVPTTSTTENAGGVVETTSFDGNNNTDSVDKLSVNADPYLWILYMVMCIVVCAIMTIIALLIKRKKNKFIMDTNNTNQHVNTLDLSPMTVVSSSSINKMSMEMEMETVDDDNEGMYTVTSKQYITPVGKDMNNADDDGDIETLYTTSEKVTVGGTDDGAPQTPGYEL